MRLLTRYLSALLLCAISYVLAQEANINIDATGYTDPSAAGTVLAETSLTANATSEVSSPRPTFDPMSFSSPDLLLQAYAKYHNATLYSTHCATTDVIVWTASAGWGDSVNALTSSFRYALATGRLFFIQWGTRKYQKLWSIGLKKPQMEWDWNDLLKNKVLQTNCQLSVDMANAYAAAYKAEGAAKPPRVVSIRGTITGDNPLAGVFDHPPFSTPGNIVQRADDNKLVDFLLRPNKVLKLWLKKFSAPLQGARTVIAAQIRTGYADNPNPAHRPSNANFLAPGDEKIFIKKIKDILESKNFLKEEAKDTKRIANWKKKGKKSAEEIAAAEKEAAQKKAKVLLITDSPAVTQLFKSEFPDRFVSVTDGLVAHSGPHSGTDKAGVLRMMTEWFLLRRESKHVILTAWSLYGSSAVEGLYNIWVDRVDSSECGKGGRPCMSSFV